MAVTSDPRRFGGLARLYSEAGAQNSLRLMLW